MYARILKAYDIDEKGEALANLEDIMAAQLIDNDIVGFKLHVQYDCDQSIQRCERQ